MPITFTKVALPYGWMGNMAPYPVKFEGKEWRTTEALFQALRFDDEAIKEEIRKAISPMSASMIVTSERVKVQEEIRDCKSPMRAKMIAKREKTKMIVVPKSEQDLANMEMILRLKLEQHPDLKQKLLDTGDEIIIEDCGKRFRGSGPFWGAALKDGKWEGQNMLGKLWMKLRDELKGQALQSKKSRN